MGRRTVLHVPGVEHSAPIPMGIRIDNFVYSSAVMGMDPRTSEVPDDPDRQVELAFANLDTLLRAAGATRDDVAHLAVALANDEMRARCNRLWLQWYPDEDDRPARHSVVQPLANNMLIQLEVVAVLEGGRP